MRTFRGRLLVAGVIVPVLLSAAACGGGDKKKDDAAAPSAPAAASAAAGSQAPSSPAAAPSSLAAPAAPAAGKVLTGEQLKAALITTADAGQAVTAIPKAVTHATPKADPASCEAFGALLNVGYNSAYADTIAQAMFGDPSKPSVVSLVAPKAGEAAKLLAEGTAGLKACMSFSVDADGEKVAYTALKKDAAELGDGSVTFLTTALVGGDATNNTYTIVRVGEALVQISNQSTTAPDVALVTKQIEKLKAAAAKG